MHATQTDFDPEAVALMGRVCDEVRLALQAATPPNGIDSPDLHHRIASRVMAAVAAGERDPARLRALAMDGLEKR